MTDMSIERINKLWSVWSRLSCPTCKAKQNQRCPLIDGKVTEACIDRQVKCAIFNAEQIKKIMAMDLSIKPKTAKERLVCQPINYEDIHEIQRSHKIKWGSSRMAKYKRKPKDLKELLDD